MAVKTAFGSIFRLPQAKTSLFRHVHEKFHHASTGFIQENVNCNFRLHDFKDKEQGAKFPLIVDRWRNFQSLALPHISARVPTFKDEDPHPLSDFNQRWRQQDHKTFNYAAPTALVAAIAAGNTNELEEHTETFKSR